MMMIDVRKGAIDETSTRNEKSSDVGHRDSTRDARDRDTDPCRLGPNHRRKVMYGIVKHNTNAHTPTHPPTRLPHLSLFFFSEKKKTNNNDNKQILRKIGR
jgi:hypothetical protein